MLKTFCAQLLARSRIRVPSPSLHVSSHRHFRSSAAASSVISSFAPVELEFDRYLPPTEEKREGAVVVLHGFLGSKTNFRMFAKRLSENVNRTVYTVNLRNHGGALSFAEPHTYTAMAADVLAFIKARELIRPIILGHSMGGKTAMTIALSDEGRDIVSRLIVVDTVPDSPPPGVASQLTEYLHEMSEVNKLRLCSRSDVVDRLAKVEPDAPTQNFLLKGLSLQADGCYAYHWPIDTLLEYVRIGHRFPFEPEERTWSNPTLFVKGTKSEYVNELNLPVARAFFKDFKLVSLDAGHMVHIERPRELLKAACAFIQ